MAPLSSGRELLDTAVSYALAGAALTTPPMLPRPTPCPGWDLETLLAHLGGSIAVLGEAVAPAGVTARATPRHPGQRGNDPVARLRGQAAGLLAACAGGPAERLVAIGDRELTAGMVAVTGAIEIAVHGWDIFATCGASCPIPPGLAAALLPAAALLVTPRTRPGLFAGPVRLPGAAGPGDQLVAFLGRRPHSRRLRPGLAAGLHANRPGPCAGPGRSADLTVRA